MRWSDPLDPGGMRRLDEVVRSVRSRGYEGRGGGRLDPLDPGGMRGGEGGG